MMLDAITARHPLKDAVKYWETGHERSMSWSFMELTSFADRMARGLMELGFVKGDQLGVWLPHGAPELTVALLAAAKIGVTAVTIDPPTEFGPHEVQPAPVSVALDEFPIKGLLVWHGYMGEIDEMKGSAKLLDLLFPEMAERDGAGLRGMTRVTGNEFRSRRYPNLQYVIHTGTRNLRQTLMFRNILIGREGGSIFGPLSATDASVSEKDAWTIAATSGALRTHGDAIREGQTLAEKMKLSPDHLSKNGKYVLSPSDAVPGVLSATLLQEALLISPSLHPNTEKMQQVIESEEAIGQE